MFVLVFSGCKMSVTIKSKQKIIRIKRHFKSWSGKAYLYSQVLENSGDPFAQSGCLQRSRPWSFLVDSVDLTLLSRRDWGLSIVDDGGFASKLGLKGSPDELGDILGAEMTLRGLG